MGNVAVFKGCLKTVLEKPGQYVLGIVAQRSDRVEPLLVDVEIQDSLVQSEAMAPPQPPRHNLQTVLSRNLEPVL